MNCYCGNVLPYNECCEKVHLNIKNAASAEMLMRSRYSAFVIKNIDFIYDSFHPTVRRFQSKREIELWANANRWMKLEIVKSTKFTVEFKAYYLDEQLATRVHHEKSTFDTFHNVWYYVDGKHK